MVNKKIDFVNEIKILRTSINKYTNLCTKPTLSFKPKQVHTDGAYDHYHKNFVNPSLLAIHRNYPKDNTYIKSYKVEILFNKTQKKIINSWMEAFRRMYNYTLYVLKKRKFNGQKLTYNYKILKSKYLRNILHYVIKTSTIKLGKKNIKPNYDTITSAIKLACANYKSAFTNLKNGNIKHFRIKYWRLNKSQLSIELGKPCFRKTYESFCWKSLGKKIKIKHDYSINIQLSKIKDSCRLVYNKNLGKYYLYIPKTYSAEQLDNNYNYVGIDPGIRTFMTCYSKTGIDKFKIKTEKFTRLLRLNDRTEGNENIPMKKKMKLRSRRLYKISKMANDIHWKISNYLTDNNRYIFIGDMSVKSIISKSNTVLSYEDKRLCYAF
jgi:putative transposase